MLRMVAQTKVTTSSSPEERLVDIERELLVLHRRAASNKATAVDYLQIERLTQEREQIVWEFTYGDIKYA
jgi:hypothetical protein